MEPIEKALEPVFNALPPLPKNIKEWLVKVWPYLALIGGLLQLFGAWGLWNLGHMASKLINYTHSLSRFYGVTVPTVNSLGVFYWVGLIVLVVDAVIMLLAYPGLKNHRKSGWDMLFLAVVVNLVYGVLALFDASYQGVGTLAGALIGSAISFYLLYQVRSYYTSDKVTKPATAKN